MTKRLLLLVTLLICEATRLVAADAPVRGYDVPAGATAAAVSDAKLLSLTAGPSLKFVRWVWVHEPSREYLGASVFSVNLVLSHSSLLVWPAQIKLPRSTLLRIDLLELAGGDVRIAQRLADTWELLADREPFFHEPDLLKADGSTRFALHAGGTIELPVLAKLTGSKVPIVRADWFFVRGLSTIDLGFGDGLYYRFRDIFQLKLEDLLQRLGANVDFTDRDVRATLVRCSNVTDRPRKVVFLRGRAGSVDSGLRLVTLTLDPSDRQTAAANDPFRNVLDAEFAAIELFFELDNGLIASALYDAAGNQQDEAPPDVVHDFYAGSGTPGTRRLQGGIIACGRCHVLESKSWYQPLSNDLNTLILKGKVRVIDDLSIGGKPKSLKAREAIELIKTQYAFDPELRTLPVARDFYADQVFKLVARHFPKDTTVAVWREIASRFGAYVYGKVNANLALQELGLAVDSDKAVPATRQLVGRVPHGVVDPIITLLETGFEIKRWQFDNIYWLLASLGHLGYVDVPAANYLRCLNHRYGAKDSTSKGQKAFSARDEDSSVEIIVQVSRAAGRTELLVRGPPGADVWLLGSHRGKLDQNGQQMWKWQPGEFAPNVTSFRYEVRIKAERWSSALSRHVWIAVGKRTVIRFVSRRH